MATNILSVDNIRELNSPDKITDAFRRLGYNEIGQTLDIDDLELSARNAEAFYDAHLIAEQGDGELQVILFKLQPSEWESPSTASTRMKAIAGNL